MRIAQIAPLWERVPPEKYGGTELVVANLTNSLVAQGHQVTLFAVAGSPTNAKLIQCAPKPLREMEEDIKRDKTHCTVMGYECRMLQEVFSQANRFDLIHNHLGFQALPFANLVRPPVVTTLHNTLEPDIVRQIFRLNAHLPYISISNHQQKLWPELNYVDTIYHGIHLESFSPSFTVRDKEYLVFLGRLSPEKGPHHAVDIAEALNMPLILAGKIDRVDREFYEREVAHRVDGKRIRYVGEVNHAQKVTLLRNAAATLCPVLWPEPFGLVLIESMACGTPVFALRNGSIPEVIDHGVTGYVADSLSELQEAVRDYRAYNRSRIRQIAEHRFSVARMAADHIRLYASLLGKPQYGMRQKSLIGGTGELAPELDERPRTLVPAAGNTRNADQTA